MASKKFILSSVIFLMLFCLLLTRETSDCSTSAYACFGANGATLKEIRNRKVLFATLEASLKGSSNLKNGEKSLHWELRKIPTGPDPLHHNSNPKKPETP